MDRRKWLHGCQPLGEIHLASPNQTIGPGYLFDCSIPPATLLGMPPQAWHALCLSRIVFLIAKQYSIMTVYDDLLAAAKSPADLNANNARDDTHSNHHHHPHEHVHVHTHDHVDHCFQYLRQSLLCCGDTALEGQDPRTDKPGTDGTGAVHVCKEFDGIMAWADSRRLVDAKHA